MSQNNSKIRDQRQKALLSWNNNETEDQKQEVILSQNNSETEDQKISKTDSNQSWYLVENFEDKIKILQQQFFSKRSEANLSDLNTMIYLQKIENNKFISEKKMQQVMTKLCSDKFSERIDIINNFFKLMSKFLICTITCFAQCCQYWKYFSEIFKIIWTIAIWKTDKKSYQELNFWKLITLLKIINKIIKAVMTTWFCNMIEKHDMLSSQQIRACQDKFTEIALILLLSQIHIVWEEKNNVATLLLLDMFEAFFRILQKQLTHIMKWKRVSKWLINWIFFFMLNRKIILVFDN